MAARKRMINPDLWTDDKVQDLPFPAVAFYIGLINFADDHGRLAWSPKQLRRRIASNRDDVSAEDVARWMDLISSVGLVSVYEVDGKEYAFFPSWRKHQYVNKAQESLFPAPPLPEAYLALTLPLRSSEEEIPYSDVTDTVPDATSSVSVAYQHGLSKDKKEKDKKEKDIGLRADEPAHPAEVVAKRGRAPCSCLDAPLVFPESVGPEDAAPPFLAVFSNCRTPAAQRTLLSAWIGAMREMRAKGHAWPGIWDAFALSHADVKHAPIRGLAGVWSNLRAAGANGRASPPGVVGGHIGPWPSDVPDYQDLVAQGKL